MSIRLIHLIIASLLGTPVWALGATEFTRPFAPSEGWVRPQEAPFRAELCLSGKWEFQPVPVPPDFKRDTGEPPKLPPPEPGAWDKTRIKIPSPWNVNDWGSGGDAGLGAGHPCRTEVPSRGGGTRHACARYFST